MSGKNNVNKDFYTLAGRDRPSETLVRRIEASVETDWNGGRHVNAQPNFIPGAAPVGESPEEPEPVVRQAQTSAGKTGVRSDSRKRASANRGGIAPGKARPKEGAFGKAGGAKARRPAAKTRAAKTRAAKTRGTQAGRGRRPRRAA
jgi:hypothetical protein